VHYVDLPHGKLEAEGVIQRQRDGFPLDQSRVAYLRYLRRERQQSPRAAADAEHALAKAALLRIRIEEKQRKLVRPDDVNELIDQLCGITRTHLSGMAARCSHDMVVRRNIETIIRAFSPSYGHSLNKTERSVWGWSIRRLIDLNLGMTLDGKGKRK
jgi:hypothetical protein